MADQEPLLATEEVSTLPPDLGVEIERYRIEKGMLGGEIVFLVSVQTVKEHWIVERKHREFVALRDCLVRRFGDEGDHEILSMLPANPSSVSSVFRSTDHEECNRARRLTEVYLHLILAQAVYHAPGRLVAFLGLDLPSKNSVDVPDNIGLRRGVDRPPSPDYGDDTDEDETSNGTRAARGHTADPQYTSGGASGGTIDFVKQRSGGGSDGDGSPFGGSSGVEEIHGL